MSVPPSKAWPISASRACSPSALGAQVTFHQFTAARRRRSACSRAASSWARRSAASVTALAMFSGAPRIEPEVSRHTRTGPRSRAPAGVVHRPAAAAARGSGRQSVSTAVVSQLSNRASAWRARQSFFSTGWLAASPPRWPACARAGREAHAGDLAGQRPAAGWSTARSGTGCAELTGRGRGRRIGRQARIVLGSPELADHVRPVRAAAATTRPRGAPPARAASCRWPCNSSQRRWAEVAHPLQQREFLVQPLGLAAARCPRNSLGDRGDGLTRG
jgi:hypothetical protein